MAYEHKPGTFTLFKNAKDGNESRPDYRGEGKDLAGNAIEVAAWIKEGKSKFLSCTFKAKGGKKMDTPAADRKAAKGGGIDDEIPFTRIGRSHAL